MQYIPQDISKYACGEPRIVYADNDTFFKYLFSALYDINARTRILTYCKQNPGQKYEYHGLLANTSLTREEIISRISELARILRKTKWLRVKYRVSNDYVEIELQEYIRFIRI